jgi:uncharacterized membrane protein
VNGSVRHLEQPPHDAWTAFGLGVAGGSIAGMSLLSFAGIFLVAVIAIVGGVRLRPRPFGAAGVLMGWGATWLALLTATGSGCNDATCGTTNLNDLTPWFAAAVGIVALGSVVLLIGIRRVRRER